MTGLSNIHSIVKKKNAKKKNGHNNEVITINRVLLWQGLEGVLRDPGFSRNRVRDSGIQNKSSRDS